MGTFSSTATVPISVAIPAFKNEAALARTLQHVFNCHPLPREVLVHFDGGWEPSSDVSASTPVPLRIFRSGTHLGPGGGRHRMITEATCDLVACFDDDSWPLDGDYFARAVAVMNLFPNAAILSPAVYLREKPAQQELAEVSEAVSFEGSASVTRKSLYLQLPGYVPVPDAYGVEEADLSLQAHAAGFQLLTSPWLRAWHDRPQADDQHGLAPWVQNEVLLAYLRYPRWLQPWGWLRALRHIINHWRPHNRRRLLAALAASPALCTQFAGFRRRYSWRQIHDHHFSLRQRWHLSTNWDAAGGISKVTVETAPPAQRVLFVQYTNPAGYPPLMHGSRLLARSGAEVLFVGLKGRGTVSLHLSPVPRVHQQSMGASSPGPWQKLHYLRFTLWALWHAWRFHASCLYVSDYLGCVPGIFARRLLRTKTVYHEHDAKPGLGSGTSWADSLMAVARTRLAREAELVVVPNQARLDALTAEVGRTGPSLCVWNCPSLEEVGPAKPSPINDTPLKIVFHGSIGPERFPLRMIQALAACPEKVMLRLAGYESPGTEGHVRSLIEEARHLGVENRFDYLGTLERSDLLLQCGECDAGLCLLTKRPDDINSIHMAGASNKPFEYLSQGLAVVVPDDEEWRKLFVNANCGITSDITDVDSLVRTFAWLANHRDEVRAMGETGRQRVLQGWNYETVFAPVLDFINQPAS